MISLLGTAGGSLVPKMKFLDPTVCTDSPGASHGYPGAVCKSGRFAKIAFNKVLPNSLSEKTVFFNNTLGSDPVFFREKAISHKNGYTGFLPLNTKDPVDISFDRSEHLTNISYSMTISEMKDTDYAYIKHTFLQIPDAFSTGTGNTNGSVALPDPSTGKHGDWYWKESEQEMIYLVKGENEGGDSTNPKEQPIKYRVYRCFFDKCVAPTAPPIPDGRPTTFKKWSKASDWTSGSVPTTGVNATIEAGWYMVQDMASTIHLNQLNIFGVLELEPSIDHNIKAKMIFISGLGGALIAGYPDTPILSNVVIGLIGDHRDPDLVLPNGPVAGAKAIAVFGRLQLLGKSHDIYWTRIADTVEAGATNLVLVDTVDWSVGDVIAVTTSTFESKQTEKLTIAAISSDGRTITTTTATKFRHSAYDLPAGNAPFTRMSAKVALITRNIRIEGLDEPATTLSSKSFGCRVLVGKYSQAGLTYSGNAQLRDVQFSNCGQLGFTEDYDPRYVCVFSVLNDNLGLLLTFHILFRFK